MYKFAWLTFGIAIVAFVLSLVCVRDKIRTQTSVQQSAPTFCEDLQDSSNCHQR